MQEVDPAKGGIPAVPSKKLARVSALSHLWKNQAQTVSDWSHKIKDVLSFISF